MNKPALTEEEIKKFEIEEDLGEVERSEVLLKKKEAVQVGSVLSNLSKILQEFPESEEILLPSIFEQALSWDEELQKECGESLANVLDKNELSPSIYAQLYDFVLESLESWNHAKWDLVYEKYIKNIHKIIEDDEEQKTVIDKGVKLACSLSELSQAIPSRCTGTKLMAMISNVIDREFSQKKLLPKLKLLCRDFNWEVRKAISSGLSNIFALLDTPQDVDKHMYEIMIELLDDEEAEVKNLAIAEFIENLHQFSEEKIEECCLLLKELLMNDETKSQVNNKVAS